MPGHIGFSTNSTALESIESLNIESLNNVKSLGEFRDIIKSIGNFKLDREIIGANINLYYVFIVFIVIILTKDFSSKTIKNTLSSAISRKKYYFSKLLLILSLATLLILFNNYLTYFLNLIINGTSFSSDIGDITKITIYQLPLLYGITCLLVCIAFTARKTALFNTISIPLIMVFQLIITIITVLFRINANWLANYEIQTALAKLAATPENSYILKCCLLGTLYIVVFGFIGYYTFKKADIK